MYTRKSLLGLWVFCEQSLSPGFGLFFLTKCRKKTKSFFLEERLSPGVLDLVDFSLENNFLKRCSEVLEQYF